MKLKVRPAEFLPMVLRREGGVWAEGTRVTVPVCLSPQVLKILLHLCVHGSPSFLLILKRNPAFIQEAAGMGRGGWPGPVAARTP